MSELTIASIYSELNGAIKLMKNVYISHPLSDESIYSVTV